MFKPADLFDLKQTEHAAIFDGCEFAWEALKKIKEYLAANLRPPCTTIATASRSSARMSSSAKEPWSRTAR